jgi:hypothetical protein
MPNEQMRIKQLYIKEYRIIKNKEYEFTPGFNLFYGPNEQGKSLTFDAMVKLLLGKHSKNFELIDRVDEDPAKYGGYVTLEIAQNGKQEAIKLQGDPNLTDLVGLTADECKNLFLIRNSNLAIGQDFASQDQFYTNLTDRLTGLKTNEIEQVKTKLRELAQITDKSDSFQNTQETNHLRQRLKQAEALLKPKGKLAQLIKKDQTEQWSEIEAKTLKIKQKLAAIQQKLTQLSLAKQKTEYEAAQQTLKKFKQVQTQLAAMKTLSAEQIDKFKENQQSIKVLENNLSELKQDIKNKQKQLEATIQNLEKIQEQVAQQQKVWQQLEQLQPQLHQLKQELAQTKTNQAIDIWKKILLGSSSILILLILAYILHPATSLIVFLATAGFVTILAVIKYFLELQKNQKVEIKLEQLKLDLTQYKIKGSQPEELFQQTEEFRQKFAALKEKNMQLKMEQSSCREDLSILKEKKLAHVQQQIAQHQQELDQIQLSCKVKSWQELQEKWEAKQKLQTKAQELAAVLEEKLGKIEAKPNPLQRRLKASANNEAKINFWQQKIERLTPTGKVEIAQQYSPQQEKNLIQEQESLQQQLEEKRQLLVDFKQQAHDLEREINDILVDRSEPLVCDTMTDIYQAQKELQDFIDHNQQLRQDVLEIIEALNEIKQQEKQKVSELFGPDSSVSQHFAHITNDRYTQVFFDQDENQIKVETKDQQILKPEQLSAGAYDQLYFSIRLGLGQKLLNDQTGFFIMDDPFLKADENRLHQQLNMLIELAENGWQVIYFSAKKEVLDYVASKADQVIEI